MRWGGGLVSTSAPIDRIGEMRSIAYSVHIGASCIVHDAAMRRAQCVLCSKDATLPSVNL